MRNCPNKFFSFLTKDLRHSIKKRQYSLICFTFERINMRWVLEVQSEEIDRIENTPVSNQSVTLHFEINNTDSKNLKNVNFTMADDNIYKKHIAFIIFKDHALTLTDCFVIGLYMDTFNKKNDCFEALISISDDV